MKQVPLVPTDVWSSAFVDRPVVHVYVYRYLNGGQHYRGGRRQFIGNYEPTPDLISFIECGGFGDGRFRVEHRDNKRILVTVKLVVVGQDAKTPQPRPCPVPQKLDWSRRPSPTQSTQPASPTVPQNSEAPTVLKTPVIAPITPTNSQESTDLSANSDSQKSERTTAALTPFARANPPQPFRDVDSPLIPSSNVARAPWNSDVPAPPIPPERQEDIFKDVEVRILYLNRCIAWEETFGSSKVTLNKFLEFRWFLEDHLEWLQGCDTREMVDYPGDVPGHSPVRRARFGEKLRLPPRPPIPDECTDVFCDTQARIVYVTQSIAWEEKYGVGTETLDRLRTLERRLRNHLDWMLGGRGPRMKKYNLEGWRRIAKRKEEQPNR